LETTSYGLVLAAPSIRTSIPHSLLEVLNFVAIGLLLLPVKALPKGLVIPYLLIPYVAPPHLVKVSIPKGPPTLFFEALAISLIETCLFVSLALYSIRRSGAWVRGSGVRAVDFW